MQIRVGFEMVYEFVARTPMVLMLNVHPSRAADIIEPMSFAPHRRCRSRDISISSAMSVPGWWRQRASSQFPRMR